jgi:dinuclear metal center YbgI/SA1388 family protein
MSVNCLDILRIIDKFAPFDMAEDWDNVGLLVGDPTSKIKGVLLSLDVTDKIVDEAIEKNTNLIISHHPIIFSGIKKLRWDQYRGRLIQKLAKNDISVICAHTNLDISPKGINGYIGELLGLENVKPLDARRRESLFKVAVYVPDTHLNDVKKALFSAGAGRLGNYEDCSFEVSGMGQFKPVEGAKPYMGIIDKLERISETKLEVLTEKKHLRKVINAIMTSHPYEEPAYDVYSLHNAGETYGLGISGELNTDIKLETFIGIVKDIFKVDTLKVAGSGKACVKKIAVCSGSGADLVKVAKQSGAQVLITGDVKYHDAQNAYEQNIHLLDVGHFASEIVAKDIIYTKLTEEIRGGEHVKIIKANNDFNFIEEA